MADLKTNYKNDVLDVTMGGKRRYEFIDNPDGTKSPVDRTVYAELGDNFGADDINATNEAVNILNQNLCNFQFRMNGENGEYKLESEGADAWRPFSTFKELLTLTDLYSNTSDWALYYSYFANDSINNGRVYNSINSNFGAFNMSGTFTQHSGNVTYKANKKGTYFVWSSSEKVKKKLEVGDVIHIEISNTFANGYIIAYLG